MADEDEEDAWTSAEEGRPRRGERSRRRNQDAGEEEEEEESTSTDRTPSTVEEVEEASWWDTFCGSAWKKMALGALGTAFVLSIVVIILYAESSRLNRRYTNKKLALDGLHSNYSQAMDTLSKDVSQSQCSRYEDTFLNWLQSFCRIVNCTSELCHKFWTPFGGNCYFFSRNILGWEESRQACIAHGSELLVIRSEEEQQFVAEYNASRVYWIGIKDNPLESAWTWVDGSSLQDDLTFWDKDYPDRYFDYELEAFKNCVFLRGGAWANAVCAQAHHWICKRRAEKPPIQL